MSEPEIARRCIACGATVRQHAMFCPQCGNPIPEHHHSETTNISGADTIAGNAPTELLQPELAMTQPLSAVTPTLPEAVQAPAVKPVAAEPKATDHSVRARVEQIRKVSSVVIDQAAYDPSLRFLLVAAGFFILFVILLVLSKVVG